MFPVEEGGEKITLVNHVEDGTLTIDEFDKGGEVESTHLLENDGDEVLVPGGKNMRVSTSGKIIEYVCIYPGIEANKQLHLTGRALVGVSEPRELTGTVYEAKYFQSPELVARAKEIGQESNIEPNWFTVLLDVPQDELPDDIILILPKDGYAERFSYAKDEPIHPPVKAILTRGGFLNHGSIMARENFKDDLLLVGRVDIDELQTGDKMSMHVAADGQTTMDIERSASQ